MNTFCALIVCFLPSLVFARFDACKIDQYLESFSSVLGLRGHVFIAKDDKVLIDKVYGGHELSRLQNPAQFCVGSITRQFTAMAVLRLVQEGRLALSDLVRKHLPELELAPWAHGVTIDHLLSYASGIGYQAPPLRSLAEVLAYLSDKPSGEPFLYGDYAYWVLGHLLECLTQEPLAVYLEKVFFKPLGMKDTVLRALHAPYADQKQEKMSRLATPYVYSPDGVLRPMIEIFNDFSFSASGLVSTVHDLFLWNQALYGGKIISEALLAEFLRPRKRGYGLGVQVETFPEAKKRYHHGGCIEGYPSLLAYFPSEKITLCILSNVDFGSTHRTEALLDHLTLLLLGGSQENHFIYKNRGLESFFRPFDYESFNCAGAETRLPYVEWGEL